MIIRLPIHMDLAVSSLEYAIDQIEDGSPVHLVVGENSRGIVAGLDGRCRYSFFITIVPTPMLVSPYAWAITNASGTVWTEAAL